MERASVDLQVPIAWHRLPAVLLVFQLLLACPGQRWVCAQVGEVAVGMNYGRVAHQILKASFAVDLMQRLGIKKVKLFNADEVVLEAMAQASGLREVMVTVTNQEMVDVSNSQEKADDWVQHNVAQYVKPNLVPITCVAVGNEPFLEDYYEEFKDVVYPALRNIVTALEKQELLKTVKVTVPMNADIVNNTVDPAYGQFKDTVRMTQICELLARTNSSFTVNIYPFYMYKDNPLIPLNLVMFQGAAGGYRSLLDRAYDGVVAALQKINYGDMKVVLGEVGWPTDGHELATTDMARRFNNACIKHLAKAQGTLLRPGQQIDAYMFSLFDEDAKSILPGPFERHWGIFDYAGRPKYPLDFTGQPDIETQLPLARSQIEFLRNRWCIAPKPYELLNPNATRDEVEPQFCPEDELNTTVVSDCSTTVENASCYFGGDTRKILNVWMNYRYQLAKQDEKVCVVDGVKGQIINSDPSELNCSFMLALSDSMLDLNAAVAAYQLSRWGTFLFCAITLIWSMLTACAVLPLP